MASVDLSLSGLASGFDWKSLVEQLAQAERAPQAQLLKEQTKIDLRNQAFGSLKTELSVLQTRVDTLKDTSLYESRTVQSADAATATATVGDGAVAGTYTFSFTQLATAAKRTGAANIGKALSPTADVSGVKLSSAGFAAAVTAGTFTVNGKQVTVASTDSLKDVFDKIATATGNVVTASYDPAADKINLSSTGEIVLGSATDTSNFLQVAKLYNNGSTSVSSNTALGAVRANVTLASANLATAVTDGGSGQGAFKINGVTIAFNTSEDSVANVLQRINDSAAGVTASYDTVNDRFVLSNKGTGDMDIALEDVTGNFLAATGLTASSLTRGKNLLYTINGGPQLVSASNTITEASSGLAGLSVTAVKEATTSVTVATDTSKIKAAITSFLDAFNRVQSMIDTQTASTTDAKGVVTAGVLASDGDASDIASSLRSNAFSQIQGLSGTLNHLADLGIQTSGETNTLKLEDSSLLSAALETNLTDLKDLFTNTTSGIAVKLADYLDRTIGEKGSLITKQDGLTKQSSSIDTQVADMEKLVLADRQRMLDQFAAMEAAQQKTNEQLQYLLKQFGN